MRQQTQAIDLRNKVSAAALVFALIVMPLAAIAQTRIDMPKNKYKVQEDVKLGNQAAAEIEKKFPILRDAEATNYVGRIGRRLVNAIPARFRQPDFDYRFKIVNASDLNAFALPSGPMYVNRGMIEAARNEGELAGVMAHEISHVALRHATAQATKQNSFGNQLGMLGMILGGAILGGEAGAQLGALGAMAWMTKYSRAYETQADILGSQIMADAGYDPQDLANVFKTIQAESKNSTPQWLSSHPDPGNRYQRISEEASHLNVSPNPIKITRDFERVQARLRAMPKAPTMAEIEKGAAGNSNPTAGGRYTTNVPAPSSRTQRYSGSGISFSYPSNWQRFDTSEGFMLAPEGAYGDQGITHGAMFGAMQVQSGDLSSANDEYIRSMLQENTYLRQQGSTTSSYIAGRQTLITRLRGTSPVTRRVESVTIYTLMVNNSGMLYIATVSPERDAAAYSRSFTNMLNSLRLP